MVGSQRKGVVMRAKYIKDNDRRQPEEISRLIGLVVEQATVDVDVRQGELVGQWASVAPGDWSLATPVGVRNGTLLVTVSDGAAASLLRYQIKSLLDAIQDRFGGGVCHAVRLKVVPPNRPTAHKDKGM